MIRGYPARASVLPGDEVVLHIATDAPQFRVCMLRWWDGPELVQRSEWLRGQNAPEGGAADSWQWPAYTFPIPLHWRSAVYIAHLEVEGDGGFDVSLSSAAILFVVRGQGRGGLLYKIPLATYHAYNYSGGGCFYNNPPRSIEPPGGRVSLQRPGGGIGGDTWGAADHYDARSPRQTFAHWDAPFIRWLVLNGYEPEFCTDLDIHADASLCARYPMILSVGHDEYWSEPTRDHVERYIAQGGNVAFFAANLCWWRVHFVDDCAAMVCHQGGPRGALDHWWAPSGANRPEDSLSGLSYRHGGGWWDGPRTSGGYVVQQEEHWVFAGTGLRNGDVFGNSSLPPLVGYECDGAPLRPGKRFRGAVELAPSAHEAGTPASLIVLAASVLGKDWQELPHRQGYAAGEGIHSSTMGVYGGANREGRSGIVFAAGTTDWSQVLVSGQSREVEQITRNVLNRLSEA